MIPFAPKPSQQDKDEAAFIAQVRADAAYGRPVVECCPVCSGVFEHVLGCPEQDAPR